MEWADKIRYIETEMGIENERGRLASILGLRPGIISDIKSGKSKNPGSDITLLLINKLGVNPEWLDAETPPVFITLNKLKKQPLDEKSLHEKVENATLPKAGNSSTIESTQRRPPGVPLVYEGDPGLEGGIVIPLLENAASAGYGADLDDEDVPARYVRVPKFLAKYPHLASLPVKGDSMEPTLHDGDLVVCDGGGWDGDGIYVLKTFETAYVKRVQLTSKGYEVISDNKMYQSFTESVETLTIVGKVRAILVIVPGRRGGV